MLRSDMYISTLLINLDRAFETDLQRLVLEGFRIALGAVVLWYVLHDEEWAFGLMSLQDQTQTSMSMKNTIRSYFIFDIFVRG